ncbi:MAG: DNA primase [Solirubrobacterales bacterium]
MARFTQASIERVKETTDVVEVISAYTDLRRTGQRFTGLCPFHDERSPSFSVNATEKLYHCFGCGAGGDVIKFVEEKEGLAFGEAVEALADRYGVELEREAEDPQAEARRKRRARLGELLERTAAFYAQYLWESAEAQKARDYLAGRELGEDVLRDFGVGYAPSAWDTVLTRGQSAGYSLAELHDAGLLVKNTKGNSYDRFRSRIIFPIRDPRGRVQGFGARAMTPDQKPKYLNSPEGELYRKSRTLYAIERARPAIAKAGRAVVVEGYTDVIAAHAAGIGETVAVMGTAITPEQVQLLAAHADEVVLAMDADAAGREAMLRAQRVAAGKRVRLRVAAMKAGEDPADTLAGKGPGSDAADAFRALVDDADDLPVFHVRTLLGDADLSSPAGRDRALDEVVPVLSAMPESITREELEREAASKLDADPGLVRRRVAGHRGAPRPAPRRAPTVDGDPGPEAEGGNGPSGAAAAGPARPLNARERRERSLLEMAIALPSDGEDVLARLTPAHLSSPEMVRARDWLTTHLEHPLDGIPQDDEAFAALMTRLVMGAEREPASRGAMELTFLWLERAMVEAELQAATADGGDPPVELQKRHGELSEQIASFDPER